LPDGATLRVFFFNLLPPPVVQAQLKHDKSQDLA
jgi:hypothetical protein